VVAIGNRALLAELDIDPSSLVGPAEALRSEGQTAMFVAVDGAPAGLVSVADPVNASMMSLPNIHPVVVHGHGDSGDPGSVGLMVDGNGVIRVVRVTVTPAGDN